MPHSPDDLTDLYSALLPAEKRYVRLCAQKQLPGKSHNYLRLFDTLAEQPGREDLPGTPSERNYLSTFILKTMRAFHEGRNVDVTLRELLTDGSFLLEKRLYRQAARTLRKARILAEDSGRHHMLLEIVQLETQLHLEHGKKKPQEGLQALHDKTKTIADAISQDSALVALQQRMLVALRTHNQLPVAEQEACADELETRMALARASGRFHPVCHGLYAVALFHHCCAAYEKSAAVYEELIALWEASPARIKEESILYKKIIANYLIVCHRLERFDAYPGLLQRMRALPCRNIEEEALKFQDIRLMELLYLMNTDGFHRLDRFAAELAEGLQRFRNKINKARELEFCHNLAMAYFIAGDCKAALTWLTKIIDGGRTEHRTDIQQFARLFRLVLWYELGKYDLLEYETINVERFLRKQNAWTIFSSQVSRLVGKLVVADKGEVKELFRKFGGQLEEHREHPKLVHALGLEELRCWAVGRAGNSLCGGSYAVKG